MPIDRDDGRHWCAPDQETPDAEGVWVCTGCGLSWTLVAEQLWVRTDDIPAFRLAEQARVATETAAVEPPPIKRKGK